mgnify:FL=1
MSNMERSLRAMVATKQLEIDKLKRKIKEMEDKFEQQRIDQGGWNNESRLRNTKNRKENKRTK